MNLQTSSGSFLVVLLLSACGAASEPPVYPDTDSASAQLFQAKCSGCHVAPQPNAHTEQVWFRVVQRMQMRMKAKGMSPLSKAELEIVLGYLQRHAATMEPK